MIRLHIKICEIKNFQHNGIDENANIYFTLKLKNDDKAECKTKIINSNDNLIWNEEIDIYANNSTDLLIINIYFNNSKIYQFEYPVSTWIVWGPMERKEENINKKNTFFGKLIFEVQSKQVLKLKIERPVKYSHVKFSMSYKEKSIMRAQNLILAARNLDESEVIRLTSRQKKSIDEDTLYFIDSNNLTHTIFDEMAEIYDMITDKSQKKICLNIIKLIVECRQYFNPPDDKYLNIELGNNGLVDENGLFNKMCENYNFRPNSRIIIYPIGKGIINNWNIDVLRIYLRMFYRFNIGFGIKHKGSYIDIWSPIEVCIKLNRLDAAKELIKYGCELPSKYRDEIKDSPLIFKLKEIFYPQTAIMNAITDENIKSITELVENPKVNINFIYDEKKNPETLLSVGIQCRNAEIIDILLSKNADPNFIDVLKLSIKQKNKELIDKLCDHGMNLNNAVYIALKSGKIKKEFWEYLFSKGADINYRDTDVTDESLLELAIQNDDEYIIEKLHDNGSNMKPALSYAIIYYKNFDESKLPYFKKLLTYGDCIRVLSRKKSPSINVLYYFRTKYIMRLVNEKGNQRYFEGVFYIPNFRITEEIKKIRNEKEELQFPDGYDNCERIFEEQNEKNEGVIMIRNDTDKSKVRHFYDTKILFENLCEQEYVLKNENELRNEIIKIKHIIKLRDKYQNRNWRLRQYLDYNFDLIGLIEEQITNNGKVRVLIRNTRDYHFTIFYFKA